jgi:hypothetical protein
MSVKPLDMHTPNAASIKNAAAAGRAVRFARASANNSLQRQVFTVIAPR